MSRIEAIKENHLFSKTYAKGKKVTEKNIVVYALRNFKTGSTRLGITTSKKLGNAVVRSRARRLIREAFRCATKERFFQKPYLIVIVARSAITEDKKKMGDVLLDLESAFQKLELFYEEKQN